MHVMSCNERAGAAGLERLLARVQRPARYIGGEWNQVVKDHRSVDITFALGFPDVYEIGMSHLGYRILYSLLNRRDDTVAERVFCPWPDMADALRKNGLPLSSLETRTPLAEFDIVGFSLQYEMTFTNVLEMLDLAGIPLRSARRGDEDPLIAVGGPVVFNVEPIADFVDLVLVGDGEELVPEFLDRLQEWKRAGASRRTMLREAAGIEGIYVPSLYEARQDASSGLLIPAPIDDAPYPVMRRIVMDLDRYPFPDRIVVPHGEIVHDRVSVEVMRGCPVGCRFCQAGYVYRPTRERDPNQVRDTVIRSVRATGYDQFSLSSLNTGEYGAIHPVMVDLMNRFEAERVSISLSSMHASTITPELAREVRRVRKSGFTIAPEAGTQRMRDVINKNLDEEQILRACRLAYEAGWDQVKLYFMIGLPTETDADVDGMVDLAHAIASIGRRVRGKSRRPLVTLSASSFVPKPETPFQWLGMNRMEELDRKQDRIASRVRRPVRFKHHDCRTSFLEGVFSRGDRALGDVIERAWRNGARFDGWDEHFNASVWDDAFGAAGLDPEAYAYRDLDPEAPLPWHVVHSRVNRKWLAIELSRALKAATLSVCGPTSCHGCAPFARDCVKGIVSRTTGRRLRGDLPLLSSPSAHQARKTGANEFASRIPSDAAGTAAAARMDEENRPTYRWRARFSKTDSLRFLGHLDVMRHVLRALRRSGLELVYSRGFNPKPRVGFGPALAVGIASEAEYVDFETYAPSSETRPEERINDFLPAGLRFDAVRRIARNEPALGEAVSAARYRVKTADGALVVEPLAQFRRRPQRELHRENKQGKTLRFDLSRELLELEQSGPDTLRMTLALRAQGPSVRPADVLREFFGGDRDDVEIVREALLVDRQGRLVDPIPISSTVGP